MFTQESFDAMPKYTDIKSYWFVPATYQLVYVIDKHMLEDTSYRDAAIGLVDVINLSSDGNKLVITSDTIGRIGADVVNDILADWDLYVKRPESSIFTVIDNSVSMVDEYDIKLIGSVFLKEFKCGRNPDDCWKKLSKCLTWLRSTDFYTCPASTQYHDAKPSGLLNHSLRVADKAVELHDAPTFRDASLEDAIFVALVHDWCKIGLYTSYKKNVKDDTTGQWHQEDAYKRVDDRTICLGHGVSSMYLVMKFFNISIDVAAAIRWHMAHWNCCEAEINELQQANETYPLVHLIQFADQLSITRY